MFTIELQTGLRTLEEHNIQETEPAGELRELLDKMGLVVEGIEKKESKIILKIILKQLKLEIDNGVIIDKKNALIWLKTYPLANPKNPVLVIKNLIQLPNSDPLVQRQNRQNICRVLIEKFIFGDLSKSLDTDIKPYGYVAFTGLTTPSFEDLQKRLNTFLTLLAGTEKNIMSTVAEQLKDDFDGLIFEKNPEYFFAWLKAYPANLPGQSHKVLISTFTDDSSKILDITYSYRISCLKLINKFIAKLNLDYSTRSLDSFRRVQLVELKNLSEGIQVWKKFILDYIYSDVKDISILTESEERKCQDKWSEIYCANPEITTYLFPN